MTELFKDRVYQVVENPHEKDAGIELLKGEWKGLVYQYGKVEFEEGTPNINFQRTIRRLPESGGDIKELKQNQKLNNLMGDILIELMEEQIKREKEDG
tara:strand:+ start:651 stop:944 length:294 start_codon:yes stop_codon:yes gene_type:complete